MIDLIYSKIIQILRQKKPPNQIDLGGSYFV
jgi:hypothetical protein